MLDSSRESKALKVVDLLTQMVQAGASDLHLKVPARPTIRVVGELKEMEAWPKLRPEDTAAIFEQVTTEQQRQVFWQERELDLACSVAGLARFRVNASLQRGTISLTFRTVPLSVPPLQELGLPPACAELALRPNGLILVTGPASSGRSTTLASLVQHINRNRRLHLVTIEDPIEFLHQDDQCLIAQREVGQDTHSFAEALRRVLRQDPDVIMVGELRDAETAALAFSAAETGRLVLTSATAVGAVASIERIIDMFPPIRQAQARLQLAATLEGVISQQLIPLPSGLGRVLASEVLVATPALRNLIREGKSQQVLAVMRAGSGLGMQTFEQSLVRLISDGRLSFEVASSYVSNPSELQHLLYVDQVARQRPSS